nr:auxin-responsive protein SAUR68-like [Ipomoea batatas]
MISSKKLIKLAKRWQKFAAIRRKRISFPSLYDDADSCSTSSAVNKGHFTIYTADQKRRGLSRELENALLISLTSYRCSSASLHREGLRNQELLVC